MPRIILIALLTLLALAPAANAAGWQRFDFDADRYYDAAAIDRDRNGWYEDLYYDLDNDGAWDTNIYNHRGHDSFLEVVDYDMDEDGRLEIKLADGDQRAGFDYVWTDLDENGYWDQPRRVIPGSNVDAVTRTTRNNASRNIMHAFSMRTGMSLLHPTFQNIY